MRIIKLVHSGGFCACVPTVLWVLGKVFDNSVPITAGLFFSMRSSLRGWNQNVLEVIAKKKSLDFADYLYLWWKCPTARELHLVLPVVFIDSVLKTIVCTSLNILLKCLISWSPLISSVSLSPRPLTFLAPERLQVQVYLLSRSWYRVSSLSHSCPLFSKQYILI